MSAVCVLTPLVIASWPAISAAVAAAAASMGFSLMGPQLYREKAEGQRKVETTVENSEVVAEGLGRGEKITIQRDDVTVEIGQDERGRCTVCVAGAHYSDLQLRRIGEEVAGRVVQQFAYNKLLSELKSRKYSVVEEEVLADEAVRIRVRL
jgi:hypothetical protein